MGIKKLPYWLRFGLILAILDLILLISIVLPNGVSEGSAILIQITQPVLIWFAALHDDYPIFQYILIASQGIIGYFVAGAIIGLVYNKIKNKNIEK